MVFKSNTLGKLRKIKSGTVFSEPLIFLKEFAQNAQRAKARELEINCQEGFIEFKDDGCGCKKADNLFTLDFSSWESTSEGFGMGFWSCLTSPNLRRIVISSYNWEAVVDCDKLFNNGDLSVSMSQKQILENGFSVRLYSDFFNLDRLFDIKQEVVDIVKYITDVDTFFNGEKISHDDILTAEASYSGYYNQRFSNRLFDANLSAEQYRSGIKVFYDYREVTVIYDFSCVSGVIAIKHGKINLKEPDRAAFIKDEKYDKLFEMLRQCIRSMFKEYVVKHGVENEQATRGISYYLSVKDYEKFLVFDVPLLSAGNFDEVVEKCDTKSDIERTNVSSADSEIHAASFFEKDQETINCGASLLAVKVEPEKVIENNFRNSIKSAKNLVYVLSHEVEKYKLVIAEAEYSGLRVFIAKNSLYENALNHRNIPHISRLSECLSKKTICKNIFLKNGKERTFIALLRPICDYYHLPYDCFRICNLEAERIFTVDGQVKFKKKLANKKDNIQIYGLTNGDNIYLDRTAIALHRFNIMPNRFSAQEIKAVMYCINTIAHELAHFLYGTVDDTVEHYHREIEVQEKLMKILL